MGLEQVFIEIQEIQEHQLTCTAPFQYPLDSSFYSSLMTISRGGHSTPISPIKDPCGNVERQGGTDLLRISEKRDENGGP